MNSSPALQKKGTSSLRLISSPLDQLMPTDPFTQGVIANLSDPQPGHTDWAQIKPDGSRYPLDTL